jgi:hypothetical protein
MSRFDGYTRSDWLLITAGYSARRSRTGAMTMKKWLAKRRENWKSDTISYTDPLTAGRHPFQTYLLSLALFSGLLQVVGAERPDALTQQLPHLLVVGWNWMLVIGCGSALIGSLWPKKNYATGLTVERSGLAVTAAAAVIYGGAIPFAIGLRGAVAAGIILAFGLASAKRSRDIGKIFKRALDPTPPDVDKEDD